MELYYDGSRASGNIALMGIYSCKMSLVLELWDWFCRVIFSLMRIGNISFKWNNFTYELSWSIQTIDLSLQDTPIPDMCERKCIYWNNILLVLYVQALWSNKRLLTPNSWLRCSSQGLLQPVQGPVSRKPLGLLSQDHAESRSHEIELRNFESLRN